MSYDNKYVVLIRLGILTFLWNVHSVGQATRPRDPKWKAWNKIPGFQRSRGMREKKDKARQR